MFKIDSHVHFWQLARGDYSWMSSDMQAIQRDFMAVDFEELRASNKVKEIVLVQAAPTIAETHFILELGHQCDFVSGVVGKVDIEKGVIAHQQLETFAKDPLFCGIRPMLKNMGENRWLELARLNDIILQLIELDLSFECMVLPSELDELCLYLNIHPDLRAVLSHGGMPDICADGYQYWADKITHIAKETQIYCKLSGLTTLADKGWDIDTLRPYVEHLLSCFGSERLIWGSDWPVMLCAGNYSDWSVISDELLSGIEEDGKQAIYAKNAQRFYKLRKNS
jgi:L-fuconolactonase